MILVRLANGYPHVCGKNTHLQTASYGKVVAALKSGKLVRPDACEDCGGGPEATRYGKLLAHHEDYAKPLDVVWLCQACHRDRHSPRLFGKTLDPIPTKTEIRRLRAIERAAKALEEHIESGGTITNSQAYSDFRFALHYKRPNRRSKLNATQEEFHAS